MISPEEALYYISRELAKFYKDNPQNIVLWIFTPNSLLGDLTPAFLLLHVHNGHERLYQFVKSAVEENYRE